MIINYNKYIYELLTEGLINTNPISIYEENVRNELEFYNIDYDLNINYENEKFNILIYNNFEKVNSIFQKLGYYISKYKIWRNDRFNFFKYNPLTFDKNIKNYSKLLLSYECYFDKQIFHNTISYHTTPIKNILKINKVGLYPSSASKILNHPSRIYLGDKLNNIEELIKDLNIYEKSDYIIYEINTNNFHQNNFNHTKTKVKFYKDPNFEYGFYTYINIPKERLKLIYKIYIKDSIIDFDNYELNNKFIKCYLKNKLVYQYDFRKYI